jgi:hypothetical protein
MTPWLSFSSIKGSGSLLTRQWLKGGDFRHNLSAAGGKRLIRRLERSAYVTGCCLQEQERDRPCRG